MSDDTLRYEDDSSILDEAELWRRIHPKQIVEDKNLGRKRPSSGAFSDPSDGSPMSVVLGKEVEDAGRPPGSVIANYSGYLLASVTAGFVRSLRQIVVRSPLPEEPAHAEVAGQKGKGVQKNMAKNSTWIIAPEE